MYVGNWIWKPHSWVLNAGQDLPLLCNVACSCRWPGVWGSDDTWWLREVYYTWCQTAWRYAICVTFTCW